MIRCKFTCQSKREYLQFGSGPAFDYEFSAITNDKTPENKLFWQYTPSGKLHVATVKDGSFQIGKDYYIDLTPVEDAV